MEHQRIMQFILNWLQINHYFQHEGEEWTTGKDAKKIHPGRYNVGKRDPFYMSNLEIPTKVLKSLRDGIDKEIKSRSK